MKAFWKIVAEYVRPYFKYLFGSVLFNLFAAIFNVFSFTLLIPILKILFRVGETGYTFTPWHAGMPFSEVTGNAYYYVTKLVEGFGASRVMLWLCLFFCIVTFIKTSLYFASSAIMVPIRNGVVRDLRNRIYAKIVSLPIGFFSQERKGDIIARMSGDVQEVENSITGGLEMLVKNPILIVIYMYVMFRMSWQLTLFTIVFGPIVIGIMSAIGRRLKADSKEAQQYWSDTMSQVDETLGGLRVIKAFLAEGKMNQRFAQITDRMRRKNNQVIIRQSSAHPVSEFLGSAMIAIVMWYGGTLILGERAIIDAPAFMSYLLILYSVIQPIKDFSKAIYGIPRGLACMERINAILDAESGITEIDNPREIKEFNDRISFRNVSFSYGNGKEILKDINLEIPKGKTIALVGASGAGKTTLVDLIPRFYDAVKGDIRIDGIPIRDLKISDLRSLMGNVNQDPILFNDTIFNNIAFGVENATMLQVEAAARIANAHEFIVEKPEGYMTNIGDRGCKLSGGQRQRISIARAILKNPPILILDEATAALDTESERSVQEALDKLMQNRTTIAIAHRLSTIKDADEIIVMDEGRIVERGRHEQLLALGGYYRKLNDMQSL